MLADSGSMCGWRIIFSARRGTVGYSDLHCILFVFSFRGAAVNVSSAQEIPYSTFNPEAQVQHPSSSFRVTHRRTSQPQQVCDSVADNEARCRWRCNDNDASPARSAACKTNRSQYHQHLSAGSSASASVQCSQLFCLRYFCLRSLAVAADCCS